MGTPEEAKANPEKFALVPIYQKVVSDSADDFIINETGVWVIGQGGNELLTQFRAGKLLRVRFIDKDGVGKDLGFSLAGFSAAFDAYSKSASIPPTLAPPPAPTIDGSAASGQSSITSEQPSTEGAVSTPLEAAPAVPEVGTAQIPQTAILPAAARVHINARQDTWIKITDHSGRTVFNRVLNAGESYEVPDEAGLKMLTGNAGGLDIVVDGTPIAPLGESGKVLRDVALDPEMLKAGTAIP